MTGQTTTGKCGFCSELVSGSVMTRHLQTCKASPYQKGTPGKAGKDNVFLIKVFSPERPQYWLFLEVDGSATLKDMDLFLRDIWLECCGHLSCFTISGIQYHSDAESVREFEGKPMAVPLSKVLNSGLTFEHEYDFGTTTYLTLKVLSLRGGSNKTKIQLIARNDSPSLTCTGCGKKATEICAMCMGQQEASFCNHCIKKHKCVEDEWSEEMALPLVNSPRTGECGYTG